MLNLMNIGSVDPRPLPRMQLFWWLRACMSVLLILAVAAAVADAPCRPFEDGRVNPKLLEVMRGAASEGRLYRVVPDNSKVGFCVRHFPGRVHQYRRRPGHAVH